MASMRIYSWNVNGLRACAQKGFLTWLRRSGADIVGVQETRARAEQLAKSIREPRGWHALFVPAERPGYSGVGLFSRTAPDAVETSLGVRRFDREGRVQLARFGRLLVANIYFPNGSGPNRDHSRIPFKLAFYRRLFEILEGEKVAGGRILVIGDFNTAHREIDLARPKQNVTTSGFTPRERRELDRWLQKGWVDTFRHFDPRPERYTWWSNRAGVRERNIGWRIDYLLASPAAMPFVQRAFIRDRVQGSDHCPVGVDVDDEISK
jgi:exodeoxyribonuclease-3